MHKKMFGSILAAVLIAVFAFAVRTPGSVAASASFDQQVHGYLQTQEIISGAQGTITQGGLLNGTTQDLKISSSTSRGTVTYTAIFEDLTQDGMLVTQDTGQSFSDGTFVEHGIIDGKASTGMFAGAVGWLTFGGTSFDEVHYTATVTGEIIGAQR